MRVACRLRWALSGCSRRLLDGGQDFAPQLGRRRLGEGDHQELVYVRSGSRSTRSNSRCTSTEGLAGTPLRRTPVIVPLGVDTTACCSLVSSTAMLLPPFLIFIRARLTPRTAVPSPDTGSGAAIPAAPLLKKAGVGVVAEIAIASVAGAEIGIGVDVAGADLPGDVS